MKMTQSMMKADSEVMEDLENFQTFPNLGSSSKEG